MGLNFKVKIKTITMADSHSYFNNQLSTYKSGYSKFQDSDMSQIDVVKHQTFKERIHSPVNYNIMGYLPQSDDSSSMVGTFIAGSQYFQDSKSTESSELTNSLDP